tara:strand:+ start:582 stop:1187 length:606 start_codon:yes stop_codon:yes gene_type:complete
MKKHIVNIIIFIYYNLIKIIHGHLKILNTLHKESCRVVCENGGNILELGFGAGVDSNFIQTHKIKSHTIIEIEDFFFEKLWPWAIGKPNVVVIQGDGLMDIPKDKKYDGIFLDFWDEGEEFTQNLLNTIKKHSKVGTIFVCATMPIFDKDLFINDPEFTYEEIDPNIKLKWYHLLSHFIRLIQRNQILAYSNKIRKVTYKG